MAAKLVNPHIESNSTLSKLLAKQTDPYTTFLNLPHITALTALCSAEPSPRAPIDGQPGDELCKPWVRDPNNLDGNQLSLAGKIVIIGDISDADQKPFPSDMAPFPPGTRPGVFMQANYIQALLDHRFLQEIPTPVTLGLLVLYVLIVYVLTGRTTKPATRGSLSIRPVFGAWRCSPSSLRAASSCSLP